MVSDVIQSLVYPTASLEISCWYSHHYHFHWELSFDAKLCDSNLS